MKKSLLLFLVFGLLAGSQATAQGGLLKKVAKSMSNELLGKNGESNNKVKEQPEPACACDDAELVMDLGGKLQLDYTELNISISDDGRILAKHRWLDEYYIVQNGVTTGPLKTGDKRLSGFNIVDDSKETDETQLWADNQYISRSGDKYLITFDGKNYGPYAQIYSFIVTKSKDKFAAKVVENIIVTEDQGKKMDEAIANAKNEQEKADLAMKYAQEMAQNVMQGGGAASISQKVITNIPGSTFDPMRGGEINGTAKYDDILLVLNDKITTMQGKTLFTLENGYSLENNIFLSSDNTIYALYSYGSLTFSNKKTMSELFNPHLIKISDKVYLAYFYYSPKKNAIMKCKIPF